MKTAILMIIGALAGLAGAAEPVDLHVTLDGKPLDPVRARLTDGRVWVATSWAAEHLGLAVRRARKDGPAVVCRGELCHVAAGGILTGDGREVDLDGMLAAAGDHVALKLIVAGSPVRYEIERREAPAEAPPTRDRIARGELLPDVSFELLTGGRTRLSAYRGRKLVLVNWASW